MRFCFLRHCKKNVEPDCVKDEDVPPADAPYMTAIQQGTMPNNLDYTAWASSTKTWCNDCNELGYQNALQWRDALLQFNGPTTIPIKLIAAAYRSIHHPQCPASRRMVENLWPYSLAIRQPIDTPFCSGDTDAAAQYLYRLFTAAAFPIVVVCWEHKHIPILVDALLRQFPTGTDLPKIPQKWDGDDFNSLWVLEASPATPPSLAFRRTSRTEILGLPDPDASSRGGCRLL